MSNHIPMYPNRQTITELKRFPGYGISTSGNVFSKKNKDSWEKMSQRLIQGYYCVSFWMNGRRLTKGVHRLMAETFLGNHPKTMHVCHNNGISTDNRIENLRWDTPKGNAADRLKHGTSFKWGRSPTAKLSQADAQEIRRVYLDGGNSYRALAKSYGVSRTVIWRVVSMKGYLSSLS